MWNCPLGLSPPCSSDTHNARCRLWFCERIVYKTGTLFHLGIQFEPKRHVAKANAPACFALRGRVRRPMQHAVIARESLYFDPSAVSSPKTQNWNCLIMKHFFLSEMTESALKHHFSVKKAAFSFIFHLVLHDLLRNSEEGIMTKCLRCQDA